MTDWRLRVLGLLGATLALAVPASASGAVTIGNNLTSDVDARVGCAGSACTVTAAALPASATAAGGLVSPIDGVVVRWRIKVGLAPDITPVALRIIRRPRLPFSAAATGGGTGPTVPNPVANQISTFDVRLPIFTGNSVGIDCCADPGLLSAFQITSGAILDGWNPPLVDNAPPRAPMTSNNYELLVNADVEPDCDSDGFGDETQDINLSSCGPGTGGGTGPGTGPAPTLPSGAPATCKGKPATILGTDRNDVRTGSQGQDVIVALGGNDTLSGLADNDVICGGSGKDTVKGGGGQDTLLGQKGKDKLRGGGGADLCNGGKGKDTASKCEVEKSI